MSTEDSITTHFLWPYKAYTLIVIITCDWLGEGDSLKSKGHTFGKENNYRSCSNKKISTKTYILKLSDNQNWPLKWSILTLSLRLTNCDQKYNSIHKANTYFHDKWLAFIKRVAYFLPQDWGIKSYNRSKPRGLSLICDRTNELKLAYTRNKAPE